MFRRMKRNDINCILLGGIIISILNIVDKQGLYDTTKIPVIAVSSIETQVWERILFEHLKMGI